MDWNPEYEKQLVEQARLDAEKFGPIYAHYFPIIQRYVEARLHVKELAEDFASQVLEKALHNIQTFVWENPSSVFAWLIQITKRLLIDYYRQQSRRATQSNDELISRASSPDSLEHDVERDVASDLMHKLLLNLPERDRQVVYYKFYNGYSNKVIAEILQISESNVGTILHRNLSKIKAMV